MRVALYFAPVVLLTGCLSRPVRVSTTPPPADAQNSYIDLQPGWRIRVIAPLTKSGSFQVAATEQSTVGNTITLSTSDDFLGYQTAYYSVGPRSRTEVQIAFISAEDTKGGVTGAPQAVPALPLFQLPRDARHVRLLYVTRRSGTDHDMAVLAAKNQDALAPLTADVQKDPVSCRDARHVFCSWIPAGIAVRPELRKVVSGAEQWVPAR